MALTGAICLILLGLFLTIAAIGDIRTRTISNRLCAAVAILAIPFWLASAPHPFAHAAVQLGLWIAVTPILLALFAYRAMGGGDVKLIAALLLWLSPHEALTAFIVMAVTGGLIALGMLVTTRPGFRPSIPYGVAIATGGLAFAMGHLVAVTFP